MAEHVRDRPLGQLLNDAAQSTGLLFKNELKLMHLEMQEKASTAGNQLILVSLGGLLSQAGILALSGAAIVGLREILPLWLSALIVGLIFLSGGSFLLIRGWNGIKSIDLRPQETVRTLKEPIYGVNRSH